MKPYGKKPQAMVGKVKSHSSDTCAVCSNHEFKISKSRERGLWKRILNAPPQQDEV